MNSEDDLVKILRVTLLVIAVGWQSALWFKMDAMLIRMKYMQERIDFIEGNVHPGENGLYE